MDNIVDENDPSVSCKPMNLLESLKNRSLYSSYAHEGKCGGNWCTNGCWKYYCLRCKRGCNTHFSSCCSSNKDFNNKLTINKMLK